MSEHITHTPTVRRLERPTDRVLTGVSSGLGRYFDLSPGFFRLGFVVLTLLGGAGILVYLAAVLVMPDEGKDRSIAEQVIAERRDRPWPLAALVVAGVAIVVLLSHASVWPAAGAGWGLVLIAGLIVLWASRSGSRAGRILRFFVAITVLTVAALATAVVTAFLWFDVSLDHGVGDRVYSPATVTEVQPSYHLGIGNLKLDLSHIAQPVTPLHVRARVDIGELRIVVPQNVSIAVNGHAKAGDITVLNQDANGRNASLHTGDSATLTIDARVGAGAIDVVRAGE